MKKEKTSPPSPLQPVPSRYYTMVALGQLGGPAALAALEQARGDEDAFVREEVEAALGAR